MCDLALSSTVAPFCDQAPNQNRAPFPSLCSGTISTVSLMFFVFLQSVDKYTREAVRNQSSRLHCNTALHDDAVDSYFLKPVFNPFNRRNADFFHSNFWQIYVTLSQIPYRSHMCITSMSSSSSTPSVNLLKRQRFMRSIFHKWIFHVDCH